MFVFALILAQALSPGLSPMEIYKRTIATMQSISAPPYLAFATVVTSTIRRSVIVQHIEHFERTVDDDDIAHDVDETVDDRATAFDIAPDMFLRRGDSSIGDGTLKIIGEVSAHSDAYTIRLDKTEDIPECTTPVHLRLQPLRDPFRYDLRELWIDSSTSRICRATILTHAHVGAIGTLATITLDLDSNGYVKHFKTIANARFVLGILSIAQDGIYSNIRSIDESAWTAAKNNNSDKGR